jgi:signal transduction histidine kinase
VRVCAQKAKQIDSHIERVKQFLSGSKPVVACLAPSFPAAIDGVKPLQLVTAARKLGFTKVVEVAFGAQLVAAAYEKLVSSAHKQTLITTPCPAIVGLIEKYYPALIPVLAPIVSPMIAIGRVVKQVYLLDSLVVFIGPCTAKKLEMNDPNVAGAIDAALTFNEFEDLLRDRKMDLREMPESEMDGPRAGVARAFAVSGGLLASAHLDAGATVTDTIVTEGRERVLSILEDKAEGKIKEKFLDILFCEGCINGPIMQTGDTTPGRKEAVIRYMRDAPSDEDLKAAIEKYGSVDLTRKFTSLTPATVKPTEEQVRAMLAQTKKLKPEDELNCGSCGYATCHEKAIAVIQGLAEAEMCLPYLIDQLQETHEALIRMERLSFVGQMAAGVAHEINNPLTGIQVYIRLLQRSLKEKRLKEDDLQNKLTTIETEISRCSKIIRGLLDFARPSDLNLRRVSVHDIVGAALSVLAPEARMAGVTMNRYFEPDLPDVVVDADQLLQVFTNLGLNAIQAMPKGGTLEMSTSYDKEKKLVSISVIDSGNGIAPEHMTKLFTPFFSTKGKGKGAGLGLTVSYGIVKRHGGRILVESKVKKGTKFTVVMPVSGPGQDV